MELTTIFLLIPGMNMTELLVVFFVILLFFGAKKLPELAKGLGRGIREFKDASTGIKKSLEEGLKDENDKK
jgi:sec-independent protein translocase protein TatA